MRLPPSGAPSPSVRDSGAVVVLYRLQSYLDAEACASTCSLVLAVVVCVRGSGSRLLDACLFSNTCIGGRCMAVGAIRSIR